MELTWVLILLLLLLLLLVLLLLFFVIILVDKLVLIFELLMEFINASVSSQPVLFDLGWSFLRDIGIKLLFLYWDLPKFICSLFTVSDTSVTFKYPINKMTIIVIIIFKFNAAESIQKSPAEFTHE